MKNQLLFLAALLALAVLSCDNKFKYDEKQKARETAESSGKIIDTIFLDYRFGMTEEELNEHTKTLRKQGKLDAEYQYTLKGHLEEYKCTIHPKFFDGKLYELLIATKPAGSTELAELKMVSIVQEKYRESFVKEDKLGVTDCERYNFFIGNLTVNIMCSIYGDVYLTYSDNRISTKAFMQEDSLKKLEENKTLQDF
jgi:hypothetical protein